MQNPSHPISHQRASSSGFTAIELMVTIALLGILMAIAAPGLAQFLKSNRLTGQANSLVSDILYARSESATRGSRVVICPSTDTTSCATGAANWASGWIIFVDTNSNGTADTGEAVLKNTLALDGATLAESTSATKIVFRPYGGLNPVANMIFKLCPSDNTEGRQIFLAATGRPSATKISCP